MVVEMEEEEDGGDGPPPYPTNTQFASNKMCIFPQNYLVFKI